MRYLISSHLRLSTLSTRLPTERLNHHPYRQIQHHILTSAGNPRTRNLTINLCEMSANRSLQRQSWPCKPATYFQQSLPGHSECSHSHQRAKPHISHTHPTPSQHWPCRVLSKPQVPSPSLLRALSIIGTQVLPPTRSVAQEAQRISPVCVAPPADR